MVANTAKTVQVRTQRAAPCPALSRPGTPCVPPGSRSAPTDVTSFPQYNPTYEQLWSKEEGPLNPYYANGARPVSLEALRGRSPRGCCSSHARPGAGITPGMRNTLGGSMERTNLASFHFEEQYQTFNTFGAPCIPSSTPPAPWS